MQKDKTIIDNLIKCSGKLYWKLLEKDNYTALEEYINTPFIEAEVNALRNAGSSFVETEGVNLHDLCAEVSPRIKFVEDLYKKEIVNFKFYYGVLRRLILFDEEIYENERKVLPLVMRMEVQGLIDYADYPYEVEDADNTDDELKKEIPLASYDGDNVIAIVGVAGFIKKNHTERIAAFESDEYLVKKGIDWYTVSQSLNLYGGYIYPCKSAIEMIDLMSSLQGMANVYLGLPKKWREKIKKKEETK